jgi:hypothetical protein
MSQIESTDTGNLRKESCHIWHTLTKIVSYINKIFIKNGKELIN